MANWLKQEMEEGGVLARELIKFAADEFGKVMDDRIEKLKSETGSLISVKLAEVRREMSETAEIQKKSAIRNLAIALFAAVLVAIVSAIYRRYVSGAVDIYFLFRSFVLAITVGYGSWLGAKAVSNYVNASKLKKDAAFYASQYFGVFRIRGVAGHLMVLVALLAVLAYLNIFMG